MNGPQHYRRAEDALKAMENPLTLEEKRLLATAAQVHALLAQVAVEADRRPDGLKNSKQWIEVTS